MVFMRVHPSSPRHQRCLASGAAATSTWWVVHSESFTPPVEVVVDFEEEMWWASGGRWHYQKESGSKLQRRENGRSGVPEILRRWLGFNAPVHGLPNQVSFLPFALSDATSPSLHSLHYYGVYYLGTVIMSSPWHTLQISMQICWD